MKNIRAQTAAVFLFFLAIGLALAWHRPLWNDEVFSLYSSVLGRGYRQILLSPFFYPSSEGNDAPLFYLAQKIWLAMIQYQPPPFPASLELAHRYSQIVLRLPWILVFSAGAALLFRHFARTASWKMGLVSLVALLSSPIVYVNWAEMRPYGLWIFLSTAHTILLLRFTTSGERGRSIDRGFTVLHWIMAFTIFLSAVQMAAAFVALWLGGERRKGYLAVSFVAPALVCVAYFAFAQSHYRYVLQDPLNVLLGTFFKSRLLFLLIASVFLLARRRQSTGDFSFLAYVWLLLAAAAGMLAVVAWRANPQLQSFVFPTRYFLFLLIPGVCLLPHFLFRWRKEGAPWPLMAAGWLLLLFQVGRCAQNFWP